MNETKYLKCRTPRCRKQVKLTKEDLQRKEQIESLGFEFAKVCKKHELELRHK